MISGGARHINAYRQIYVLSKKMCNGNIININPSFNKLSTRKHSTFNRIRSFPEKYIQYGTYTNRLPASTIPLISPQIMTSLCEFSTTVSNAENETVLNPSHPILTDNNQSSDSKEPEAKAISLDFRDYFDVHKLFTTKDLFNARVHLGHSVRSLLPQMRPFIYGVRFDTCIFDLDETALLLRQALNFMAHVANRGGIILFVARQPQMVHMVERTAIECGEYAQCRQWSTETFTATRMVRFRVNLFI